jgi:hypothetical protein
MTDSAERAGGSLHAAEPARFYSAGPDADALDRELARRLNQWPTDRRNSPDFFQPLRPVILKAALWWLAGCLGVVVTYFLLC